MVAPLQRWGFLLLDVSSHDLGWSMNLFSWTRATTERVLPFGMGTKGTGWHHHGLFSVSLTTPSWASDMIVVVTASEYLWSVCGSGTDRWGGFPSGHSLGRVAVFLLNSWASVGTHSVLYLSSRVCLRPSWVGKCDDSIGSSRSMVKSAPCHFRPKKPLSIKNALFYQGAIAHHK